MPLISRLRRQPSRLPGLRSAPVVAEPTSPGRRATVHAGQAPPALSDPQRGRAYIMFDSLLQIRKRGKSNDRTGTEIRL